MNNPDNFFEAFKKAAREQEGGRFAGYDEVWLQVEKRLDEKQEQKPAIILPKRRSWLAAAALLVALLGAGLYLVTRQPGKELNPVAQTQPANKESTTRQEAGANPGVSAPSSGAAAPSTRSADEKTAALQPRPGANAKPANPESTDAAPLSVMVSAPSLPQRLSGQVLDEKGNSLSGASVALINRNIGTVTDSAGRFSLPAQIGDSIRLSALGFESNVAALAANHTSLTLAPSSSVLSEVVVIGYSSQKKRDITGSVQVAAPTQGYQSSSQVGQMLQGKAPGLSVGGKRKTDLAIANIAGTPGSSMNIRIRGANSLKAGNAPLYLVNGTVVSEREIKKLTPDNIEKVEVLNDASAAAIYGSRAANGLVVISTKNRNTQQDRNLKKWNELRLQSGIKLEPEKANIAEMYQSEDYNRLIENPFTSPRVSPLSTFSIDVDNASYSNIRRFINLGQEVPEDAVRVEEMINYFRYDYPEPAGEHPFSVYPELSEAPWNPGHQLLRLGLKAKNIPDADLPAMNLVLLIDVSGSMNEPNKLPLLKSSMKVLVDQLRPADLVAIVVYAGAAGLVLPSTGGNEKQKILDALNQLNAGGSTAGGQGIELAYKTAQENFVSGGNNRIVLATDGDFNIGIQSNNDLQRLIEEKRKSGIFLTCLGFGMGNYKDSRLEMLADKGNGNYAYIDNYQEATRFLGKEFKGNMYAVAKDVKLQIEFNPSVVQAYRLIGYENRMLHDEDFANDKIDAGEMGAGHTVTALYEIIPVGSKSKWLPKVPQLKFRYKKPDADTSIPWEKSIENKWVPLEKSSASFRFATAVAWFGLKLRKSDLISNAGPDQIKSLAIKGRGEDADGYRAEFSRLLESVKWSD
jgi:Ca-activated chloride channel family protein